jgi:hypothetical protein
MDPDPGGPKTYGFGSATLPATLPFTLSAFHINATYCIKWYCIADPYPAFYIKSLLLLDLKKTIHFSGFKILSKKICEKKEHSSLFIKSIL